MPDKSKVVHEQRKQEVLAFLHTHPDVIQKIAEYVHNPHVHKPSVRSDAEVVHSLLNAMARDVVNGCSYHDAVNSLVSQIKASTLCYYDLIGKGLAAHYPQWEVKKNGRMTGVTLFGVTKKGVPKKVFVKSYCDVDTDEGEIDLTVMDELVDYAAFNIAKTCGVCVPKVKLKGVAGNAANGGKKSVYIFSTDIAEGNKHPDARYRYFNVEQKPFSVSYQDGNLVAHEMTGEFVKYPLDKTSMARIQLIALMLNLTDLHRNSNIGYLVSDKQGAVKVKLASVDFGSLNPATAIRCRDVPLLDLMNTEKKFSSDPMDFISKLTESDYIDAFKKIEENFLPACDEVLARVKAMPFESEERKEQFSKKMAIWRANFNEIQLVVGAAQSHLQAKPT